MWKTYLIVICAFALPLFSLLVVLSANPFELLNRRAEEIGQAVEGSSCQLEYGGCQGECAKAVDCLEKLTRISVGGFLATRQCGYPNSEKMICCKVKRSRASKEPKNITRHLRRAAAACESFKDKISQTRNDTPVFSVVSNGFIARPGEFPYTAALGYVVSEDTVPGGKIYVCGGTLISKKHVLTAAHCVSNIDGLVPVEVILGVTDLVEIDKSQVQRFSISKITKHPRYIASFHYHDIAVLELEEKVNFTAYVKPACLMTKRISKKNSAHDLVVLGWPSFRANSTLSSSKLLKATRLDFVRTKECSKTYLPPNAEIPDGLDEGMICVRDPNVTRKADTCWGNSGGPLLGASTPYPPLVGVTSFGVACGVGLPAVYTSVYKYLSWIEDQVWPKANRTDRPFR